MDTNKDGVQNQREFGSESNSAEEQNLNDVVDNFDKEAADDMDDTSSEDRRHHQEHGNRKYESHTNHNSANDQPQTTTDTNLGRDLNWQ